ncbi:MAG: glycosyltransferase [Euzebya sp.]
MAARGAETTLSDALQPLSDASRIVIACDPADQQTWQTARHLAVDDARVVVVPNPGARTAVGLNLAIAQVSEPVIARIDAHTIVGRDYLARAVEVLTHTGAAVVGGRQMPVGSQPVQRGIAAAMDTWAGSGGARHRRGGTAGPSETAYLGVFQRSWLDIVNGYDPRLDRNQDYEICHRIARAGGLVWFDPALKVRYLPRESWPGLFRQYHEFGRWKRHVMTTSPLSVRSRQIVAPALVVALAASAVMVFTRWRRFAAIVPGLYVIATIGSILPARPLAEGGPVSSGDQLRAALALLIMHVAWGTGFFRGGRP